MKVRVFPSLRMSSMLMGSMRSIFAPGVKMAPKSKLGGSTPTMVTGWLFMETDLPTMLGCMMYPPEGVGEEHDWRGPFRGFLWDEVAAKKRRDAEHTERGSRQQECSRRAEECRCR